MKKRKIIVLTILCVVFIIAFLLLYFYFIRDWRSKANLDTKTLEMIADKVNESDFEFSDFTEASKQIKDKYENMGYEVTISKYYGVSAMYISNLLSSKEEYNDFVYVYFIENDAYDKATVNDSLFAPYSDKKSFKYFLNREYGLLRPIFTCFCSKQSDSDYKYYFTPFCWQKGEYHLAGGREADCYGIMIFKNYTISIYYSSNDIEHCNNFNSFLKNLSDSMS